MSYLIKNDEVIATTSETLKSGQVVQAAWDTTEESINADRDVNLVNAFDVKVSNAKKWDTDENNFLKASAIAVNGSNDEYKLC